MLQVQGYNKDMEINMIAKRQHINTQRHIPTPLQVAGWEARRYWANRSSRRLAITAFGLLFSFSFLLALLLPLLSSAGVAHDVKHRTHELLMTTPVPTWAYIIGRYLFYLLASVGLALILFVAFTFKRFRRVLNG